jgi:hypothetical protein
MRHRSELQRKSVTVKQTSSSGLAGVIEDDLPASAGLLEDEREDAGSIPATDCAACQVEATGDGGEVRVEPMYFELTEGELAHLFFAREGFLITGEDVCVSMLNGFADEGGGRGILVAVHEGDDIAAVPGIDLRVKHTADCSFILRCSVSDVGGCAYVLLELLRFPVYVGGLALGYYRAPGLTGKFSRWLFDE